MPLGVLVTLANPGAIATSDLFRRFEITDLNHNNNNKEEKRPLEKFPFDGEDSFKRIPLGNEVPLGDQDIFQHRYSSLYDSFKMISRLRKMITSYGGSRSSRSRSDHHTKNSKKSDSILKLTNSLYVPSNRNITVSATGSTLSSISSSSSSSVDSSPFDIINKPLIFSIPGL
jgi:hypothetical protein